MRTSPSNNKLRIIAGSHRNRKISFVITDSTLKPTADRARETVFNWLNPYLPATKVLDAFAGSGIMGFEALSRGAKKVVALEHNPHYYNQMQANAQLLKLTDHQSILTNAEHWLGNNTSQLKNYDIIFLDPPFQTNLLASSLAQLLPNLSSGTLVYTEQVQKNALDIFNIFNKLKIIKHKVMGNNLLQLTQIT